MIHVSDRTPTWKFRAALLFLSASLSAGTCPAEVPPAPPPAAAPPPATSPGSKASPTPTSGRAVGRIQVRARSDQATPITNAIQSDKAATPAGIGKHIVDSLNALPVLSNGANAYDIVNAYGDHLGDGAQDDVVWRGNNVLLQKDIHGTYCRGFTMEQFIKALKETDSTAPTKVSFGDMQKVRDIWFGKADTLTPDQHDRQAAAALELMASTNSASPYKQVVVGEAGTLDQVDPATVAQGDIMVLRRDDSTAHCVVFLNWLYDSSTSGNPVGLIYYSSQAWSTGYVLDPNDKWDAAGNKKPTLPTSSSIQVSGYSIRADFFNAFSFDGKDGMFKPEASYYFHFK